MSAYDGEVAIEMVKSQKPDLIVLDLMLPGIEDWKCASLFGGIGKQKRSPS